MLVYVKPLTSPNPQPIPSPINTLPHMLFLMHEFNLKIKQKCKITRKRQLVENEHLLL